jgi:hypothetical protein
MQAVQFHGALPFIMDSIAISRGGAGMLDSFRARLLCGEDWEADARSLGYEIDRKLSTYPSLWIKSMEPQIEAEDVVVVDISGEGLATGGDRRQRKMKCGEMQTSVGPNEKTVIVWNKEERGEDPATGEKLAEVPSRRPKLDGDGEVELKTISTPSGSMHQWLVSEGEVSVIDTYFTTTKPVMTGVSKPFTPPNAPSVPAYQWGGYSEAMRGRHPNGWVLADRDVDEIYYFSDTVGLWRVSDTSVFRHAAFPE